MNILTRLGRILTPVKEISRSKNIKLITLKRQVEPTSTENYEWTQRSDGNKVMWYLDVKRNPEDIRGQMSREHYKIA